MTKTIIRAVANNRVILTRVDDFSGETVTREFWAPACGGYVREGDAQVCDRLSHRGHTLEWFPSQPLVNLIRAEYRAKRRAERRAA